MSSNNRGDEPRGTPSGSSRQRPDRPTASGHRADNDPRVEAQRNRPANGTGNHNPSTTRAVTADNVVALGSSATTSKRPPSRRAKPMANGSSTVHTDPDPIAAPVSPVTEPIALPVPSVPPTRAMAPPPPLAVAPAPPPAPAVIPLPPSVFDDESDRTGAMPFEASFDPELDQGGVPRRQRAVQFTQTGRRRRPRLRRVTRVVRHVDPWSVFKVALCFSLVLYGVCLTAGVLLWNVAHTTGTIDNVQRFFESFGWDTFRFKGGELYHNAWIAGLFAALGLTGVIVLAVTLFNLITDLVGGIRVTVLEEEVVERNPVVRGPLLGKRTRAVSMITPDHPLDPDADPMDAATHLG